MTLQLPCGALALVATLLLFGIVGLSKDMYKYTCGLRGACSSHVLAHVNFIIMCMYALSLWVNTSLHP